MAEVKRAARWLCLLVSGLSSLGASGGAFAGDEAPNTGGSAEQPAAAPLPAAPSAPAPVPPVAPVAAPAAPVGAPPAMAPSAAAPAPTSPGLSSYGGPPERAPTVRVPVDRSSNSFSINGGHGLMLAYGGASGMYSGGSLGFIVNDEAEAAALGAVAGGAVGLGTSWILLRNKEVTVDQAVLIGSGGTYGAFAGYQLARAFIPPGSDEEERRIAAAGLLGHAAGTGMGVLLGGNAPSYRRMMRADVAAAVGWQVGAGAADLRGLEWPEDRQVRAGLGLAGSLAMGGVSLALPEVEPKAGAAVQSALFLSQGTWLGIWAPVAFTDDPDARQVWGGARLGIGLGYLAATAITPFMNTSAESIGLQVGGTVAGNALGAGIPLAVGVEDPQRVAGSLMIGSVAGQALGVLVAPLYEASANDAVLLSYLEAWTGYQAIGWGVWGATNGAGDARPFGYGLTAGGVGTLVAGAMVPLVDLTPAESTMMATGGAWGTWFGAWGSEVAGLSRDQRWGTTLAVGNIALVGTAIGSGVLHPTWRDVGVINGMGAVGGAVGALGGVIFAYDPSNPRGLAAASLVGSGLGLAGGALIATRLPHADVALLDVPWIGRSPVMASVVATPWQSEDGDFGGYVELRLDERD